MKSLPAGVDLDKLEIASTKGVNLREAVSAPLIVPVSANLSGERLGKRPRYGRAKRIEHDGHTFDSEREFKRYQRLKIEQLAGEITGLMVHPHFVLMVNGVPVYAYTPDFLYHRKGIEVVEDVKSKGTRKKDSWPIIQRLWLAVKGYALTEVLDP